MQFWYYLLNAAQKWWVFRNHVRVQDSSYEGVIHLSLWELEGKYKIAANSIIGDALDLSVELSDKLFADVQPKTYPLRVNLSCGIKEPKLFEKLGLVLYLDAYTIILYWNPDLFLLLGVLKRATNCYLSSIRSKLQSVALEVKEHLLKSHHIRKYNKLLWFSFKAFKFASKIDIFGVSLLLLNQHDLSHCFPNIEVATFFPELTFTDLCE